MTQLLYIRKNSEVDWYLTLSVLMSLYIDHISILVWESFRAKDVSKVRPLRGPKLRNTFCFRIQKNYVSLTFLFLNKIKIYKEELYSFEKKKSNDNFCTEPFFESINLGHYVYSTYGGHYSIYIKHRWRNRYTLSLLLPSFTLAGRSKMTNLVLMGSL